MPDLAYYIGRLRELPLGTALRKAAMKPLKIAAVKLEKVAAGLSPAHISDGELLQNLEGFTGMEGALHAIRGERPAFFVQPSARERLVSLIQREFPQFKAEIVEEAERVCHHVFDLLGSGPVNLDEFAEQHGGKQACGYLPWHYDFKTGYRWSPGKFYKEIEIPYGKADIKVPWELSRFQHAAVLGQAYWLTGDEKYAREFVRQVDDWIDCNPPKFGVNWACTMDVAIRVANWILGFYFFRQSQALTGEFLVKFLKSLLTHGRHIMANLENKGITTNHYLADLVGLIYLGIAFPEFKEAGRWREFGVQELVAEMAKQVHEDGMDFEASTCYHRLALELFFYPALLCRLNGIGLPQAFVDRLKKMFDFVLCVLKPNGRMPQIGDNDNGRLHVLGRREILDMTYLLTFAALYYGDPAYKIQEFGFAPEALWVFGPDAYERWSKLPGSSVVGLEGRAFADGGIYVIRRERDYMAISCGSRGHGGRGGHAHHDKLAFELCIDKRDIIVDPGTGVYTLDPKIRNYFRSPAVHSAPRPAREIRVPNRVGELFVTRDCASTRVLKWEAYEDGAVLVAKKTEKVGRRLFALYELFLHKKGIWAVMFRCSYEASSPVILMLTLAPGLAPERDPEGVIKIRSRSCAPEAFIVPMGSADPPETRVVPTLFSPQYGSLQETLAIEYSWSNPNLCQGLIILSGSEARQGAKLLTLEEQLRTELDSECRDLSV